MEEVNYIQHLNGIFGQFAKDSRLNPSHISLYMALFQLWNINYFDSDFYINRQEVMKLGKLGSKATYHRSIKDLDNFKYIRYMPSHNPFHGSRVSLFNFGTSAEQAVNLQCPKNGTSPEQAVGHINKHIQTGKNNKNLNKPGNFKNQKSIEFKNPDKLVSVGQNRDNLKTTTDKDYGEPL